MKNLSIIIPVYNTKDFLQTCFNAFIDKAKHQISIEVIFVNDGSTDGSLEILNEFQKEHDFVKIVNQENQGLSGARNSGIQAAEGTYFILLDSDDWLNWEEILSIYNLAVDEDLDLAGFRLQFVDEHFKVTGISVKHPLEYEKIISGPDALIEGYQPSSACLFMYKTSYVIKNDLKFYDKIYQGDVEFTVRLLLLAERMKFTDKIGYNYYKRADSITTTISKEGLEKYLSDSIIVAEQIRNNKLSFKNQENIKESIEKNYNSVIWNLFWRFLTKPKETSWQFKKHCFKELKLKSLYPIKGALKTPFQNKSRILFNCEALFKYILKIRN